MTISVQNRGKFITFEGGEGSGKSTQSKKLADYLASKGISAILTREIGGTKEAEQIRNLLVHNELYKISELLLVMAARYEHVQKVILPNLQKGVWVICDRYVDSTAAYQSEDSGLKIREIYELHDRLIPGGIMPDVTFFMDISPELGLKRSKATGDVNKFEEKEIAFHQNLYKKFRDIASLFKDRIVPINCGNKSMDEVHHDIISYV